jgi:hypothetical protein
MWEVHLCIIRLSWAVCVGLSFCRFSETKCGTNQSSYDRTRRLQPWTAVLVGIIATVFSAGCIFLSLCPPLSLWLHSPLDLDHFFSFLNLYTVGRILGRGISPSQGRYIHTEQHKHTINAHGHPCLKWNLIPRSRCSSGRRQLMP